MYQVYILKSLKTNRRYIGYTKNFNQRFWEHNNARKGFSLRHKPFKIIFLTNRASKKSALALERYLKKQKGSFKLLEIITVRAAPL